MIRIGRDSVWLLFVVAILLAPFALFAQEKPASGVNVTGCLQKGLEHGGFYLTDESGKTYELKEGKISLGEHVGHQVTVAGAALHNSAAKEAKLSDFEKREANGKSYEDIKVTGITMVSASCK